MKLRINELKINYQGLRGRGLNSLIGVSIIILMLLVQCENKERFYRPNLPEKLCIIGIIDADEDYQYLPFNQVHNKPIARVITIEKSYQTEYSQEMYDSLREFSFSISSSEKELFRYNSDSTIKVLKNFSLPENIEFRTGEKYFLTAFERNVANISAVSYVPEPPSKLNLISSSSEIKTFGCSDASGAYTRPTENFKLSFENDTTQNLYYAILIEGIYEISSVDSIKFALSFEINESNSPGFFAELSGYTQFKLVCMDNKLTTIKTPYFAYFIEGNKIPENECTIRIATFFQGIVFHDKWRKKYNIKLLSIPKELFLYEKSLYTYDRNSLDPFSEPVYLNGNIKGGNGVFAICRSSDLIIDLAPLMPGKSN